MAVKYGDWLKYVMRAEGVKEDQLVRKSGLSAQQIDQFIANQQEPSRSEIDQIATAMNISKRNMDKSLEAMQVYDKVPFRDACSGGCCPWNAPVD